jgi:hypothetical protein
MYPNAIADRIGKKSSTNKPELNIGPPSNNDSWNIGFPFINYKILS